MSSLIIGPITYCCGGKAQHEIMQVALKSFAFGGQRQVIGVSVGVRRGIDSFFIGAGSRSRLHSVQLKARMCLSHFMLLSIVPHYRLLEKA